jgi:transposase InsO family protein
MCRVLEVSPARFYAAQRRAPSARARGDQRLRLAIRTVHAASHQRYGAPKVQRELRAQGIRCGQKRVARLMRADGLRARRPRRFRVTTDSAHRHQVAPNHLQRRFAVAVQPGRDRIWAADLTYLPTRAGWLYLAVVLDLASRRVVGWGTAAHREQGLTLTALERALVRRQPAPGGLHHSDRGVQYAGAAYQALLARHGFTPSMSRVGNCWDNAVVESFFATLKSELVVEAPWATRAEAHRAVSGYLAWYNHERRHASLDYRSPAQYERDVLDRRVAA